MNIGCHVSIAGGISEAPQRAADLNCECMQIFTRSPQGGKAPELTEEIIKKFKLEAISYKLKATYIHTPYYINFASANNRIRYGSVSVVRDELERGRLLGAKYVMTHLGTAKELGKDAIPKTIEMLKKCLEGYAGETQLLLENSAGAGDIIGDDLQELGEIIKGACPHTKINSKDSSKQNNTSSQKNEGFGVGVNDKNIAGICLDTQHSFASGYDWNDFEKTLKRIDEELGLENIKLIHLNNSETELGSKKDRHAHLDSGKISLQSIEKIIAFAQAKNIDLILETEHDRIEEDIEILKNFRK